jgi:hypothetical protein
MGLADHAASSVVHLPVIGEDLPACGGGWAVAGRLTRDAAEVTCPACPGTWPYAVAMRRASIPAHWWPVSVEPAADFGNEHGLLAVSDSGRPDRVVIEQADRFVYVPDEWVQRAAAGAIPWAEVGYVNPWRQILRIRGTDRTVIYEETGSCGPRVPATIFVQPD